MPSKESSTGKGAGNQMKLWLEEEKKTYTASEYFKSNQEDGFRYVDKTELLILPWVNKTYEKTERNGQ